MTHASPARRRARSQGHCVRRLAAALAGLGALLLAQQLPSADEQPRDTDDDHTLAPADPHADDEVRPYDTATDDDELYIVETVERRPARAASEKTLDAATLALTPADTAEDYLRLSPGVLVVQHGSEGKGHQLFLRGFDAAHGSDLAVTLAGAIPLNEPSNIHGHGYLDLVFVVPEAVAALHVNKGPFTLEAAPFATAGHLDLELGVPDALRGSRVGIGFETTDRYRVFAVVAPVDEHERNVVAVEALHDSGFGENRLTQRASAIGQWVVLEVPRHHLRLETLASGYLSRFGLPGALRLDDLQQERVAPGDAYLDDTGGLSARTLGAVRLAYEPRGLELETTLFAGWRRIDLEENFTGDLLSPEHGDRRRQAQDETSFGLHTALSAELTSWLDLRAIAAWHGGLVDQREDALEAAPPHRAWTTHRSTSFLHHTASLAAGALFDLLDDGGTLSLETGARLDLIAFAAVDDRLRDAPHGADLTAVLSPRARLAARVHPTLTLFAAYGRGVRPHEARSIHAENTPAAEELARTRLTSSPAEPTIADAAELGLRWNARFADVTLETGLAAFGTWLERESLFDHVSGLSLARDGSQRLGLELDVSVRPLEWLELAADLTFVHTAFTTSGNPVPGVPTLLGNLRARLSEATLGVYGSAQLLGVGSRPLAWGATASSFAVLDLVAGVRRDFIGLELGLENVLGTDYAEAEYQFASHWSPSAPRSELPVVHSVAGQPRTFSIELSLWF